MNTMNTGSSGRFGYFAAVNCCGAHSGHGRCPAKRPSRLPVQDRILPLAAPSCFVQLVQSFDDPARHAAEILRV